MVLQQQYRENGFTKYSQLISCLLVAEQNNELLLKNHEAHPTSSIPFPGGKVYRIIMTIQRVVVVAAVESAVMENIVVIIPIVDKIVVVVTIARIKIITKNRKVLVQKQDKEKRGNYPKNAESICYRCGMNGHWKRTCRTAKHLVDLYQASLKDKGKI
ncbi:uncharacterized protein LOC116005895 [Ipomoea triloba]|uniref:uncharacterized protein LOC116005895 n=1 Tax=Ipomoea triloba TaxID=35885 RepID=UPI00125E2D3B|nr:uncharacterized protein LOC116005895 [Ipomoea triloba]